ncbi:hypothetical protein P4112_28570 [Pseudomonas aeruginosa]|nr:hypothetical protein [Pseudomonas aeruginosa]
MRNAEVDVTVLALVGERGRASPRVHRKRPRRTGLRPLGAGGRHLDRPAMERAKAGFVATSIAEYFRDQGRRVLLLMDSLTRFARAQREIGLAAGEPPPAAATRPRCSPRCRLMERAGQSEQGSITALYTVLVEGDDMSRAGGRRAARSRRAHRAVAQAGRRQPLSGHRRAALGEPGHEPDRRRRSAPCGRTLARMASKYEEVELLLKIGEYQKGQDSEADRAIEEDRGDPPSAPNNKETGDYAHLRTCGASARAGA